MGHSDMNGGRACALKVGGLAGVDASIPSPGLFHIQGTHCLLLYLALLAYHIGPLTDVQGVSSAVRDKKSVFIS